VKSRINATIEHQLLRWVDSQIQLQKFRSRSHAIEYALLKLKAQEENKPIYKMLKTEKTG
jgi:Arc/MetJ-type ribon-helix-helix transcriptional regulator